MEIWTGFVLGLVGSLHCAGMCGPLVLALPGQASASSVGRAGNFVLGRGAYNLGRVLTYCILGLLFGLLGKSMVVAGVQRWACIGLGVLLLAALFGSRRINLWQPFTMLVGRLKTGMSGLLRRRSLASLSLLGLLNGLLPCGLVYAACAGAASTSSPWTGALYMAAFGAGTLPMLLLIAAFRQVLPAGIRIQFQKAIPVTVVLLASLLILRGMSLGIPYLSPDLAATDPSCCHK